jgi:hypothetical protein
MVPKGSSGIGNLSVKPLSVMATLPDEVIVPLKASVGLCC